MIYKVLHRIISPECFTERCRFALKVETIVKQAEQAFGSATAGGVKVVLRGVALPVDKPNQLVELKDGGQYPAGASRHPVRPQVLRSPHPFPSTIF